MRKKVEEVQLTILPHFPPYSANSIHETAVVVKFGGLIFKVDSVVKEIAEDVWASATFFPHAGDISVFTRLGGVASNDKSAESRRLSSLNRATLQQIRPQIWWGNVGQISRKRPTQGCLFHISAEATAQIIHATQNSRSCFLFLFKMGYYSKS